MTDSDHVAGKDTCEKERVLESKILRLSQLIDDNFYKIRRVEDVKRRFQNHPEDGAKDCADTVKPSSYIDKIQQLIDELESNNSRFDNCLDTLENLV